MVILIQQNVFMKTLQSIIFILTFLFSGGLFAQEHHSKADIFLEYKEVIQTMKIGLYIELEEGWHTYWTNPGETGMGPVFEIQSEGVSFSQIIAPAPKRISTPTADSFAFENEVLFYKEITSSLANLITTDHVKLTIQADWLVCKEICIPCSKTFELEIPLGGDDTQPDSPIFSNFLYPKNTYSLDSTLSGPDQTLLIRSIPKASHYDVFPIDPMDIEYIKPTQIQAQDDNLSVTFSEISENDSASFLVVGYDKNNLAQFAQEIQVEKTTTALTKASPKNQSLFLILLLSLVGGFLLNLMPCVFPVISIKFFKISTFTNKERKKLIYSNLVYSLGVISSFIALAFTLVFLRSLGNQLGWGFQLQSPISVALMIFLFYIIGLNFLGIFEVSQIPIPSWINKKMYDNGFIGDFFTGVFTTAVATPCTAPFMAASIGYALTQNIFVIFLTFFMLGIGLSLPYLLICIFPNIASRFPKPGPWMNALKEILSFPMFLTCAWLIWVYSKLTSHMDLLYLLIGLVFVEFAFRSFHWTKKKYLGILMVLLSFGIVLLPYSRDMHKDDVRWIEFSPNAVQALVQQNHWVFVDFTADWCLTCKANEALTLNDQDVLDAITNHNIQMVKADWTKKDPIISQELAKYGRIGVPFYLLYKPGIEEPIILPTVLTPSSFLEEIQ